MQVVPDDVPLLLRLFGPNLDGKAHVDVGLKIRGGNDEGKAEKGQDKVDPSPGPPTKAVKGSRGLFLGPSRHKWCFLKH